MLNALILKEKIKKISTIIEHIDIESLNSIEKDILLQEIRDLYSLILFAEIPEKRVLPNVEASLEPSKPAVTQNQDSSKTNLGEVFIDDIEFINNWDGLAEKETPREKIAQPEPMSEVLPQPSITSNLIEEQKPAVQEAPKVIVEQEPAVQDVPNVKMKQEIIQPQVSQITNEPKTESVLNSVDAQKKEFDQATIQPVVNPEVVVTNDQPQTNHVEFKANAANISTPVSEVNPKEEKTITLAEQLGQFRQTSRNDILASGKSTNYVSSKIGLKPITDIKSAIGVGDRFLYIRELFSGSGSAFEGAIVTLNSLNSYENALDYLQNNYNWDMSSDTVSAFLNVVRRRYL